MYEKEILLFFIFFEIKMFESNNLFEPTDWSKWKLILSSKFFLVIKLITPPIAEEPYSEEDGPLTISIFYKLETANRFKSKFPESLPTLGTPSTRIWT